MKPSRNQIPIEFYTSYKKSGEDLLRSGDLDSAELRIAEALEAIDDDQERYLLESIAGYQALKEIYSARGDEVNVAAINNFIIALNKKYFLAESQKSANSYQGEEETVHQRRLREIREQTKAELESCVVSSKAPYPNSEKEEVKASEVAGEERLISSIVEEDKKDRSSNNIAIQNVYKNTSERLRNFVKDLIKEVKVGTADRPALGEPPHDVKYAVVCFGSLARDEATPYSDLEFGILLDEETKEYDLRKLEEIKDYFRRLTKELNIKIINLGETTIRIQNIESIKHLRSPTQNGFSFDGRDRGGCKTPLGNVHRFAKDHLEPFELIMTPSQMAEFHNEEWYRRDKHMSTALMTSSFVEGNYPQLDQQYKSATNEVLNRKVKLFEGELEKIPTIREKRAFDLLKESSGKFEIRAGKEEEKRRSFSPKYDFYRPPVMLIDHLALLYGVEGNSVWERFNQLFVGSETSPAKLPINNEQGIGNLRWMLDRVLQIRLKNYINHGTQKEDMPLIDQEAGHDKLTEEERENLTRNGLGITIKDLFEVYYVMLGLDGQSNLFIDNRASKNTFKDVNYNVEGREADGYIYYLLSENSKAIECFQREIEEGKKEGRDISKLLNNIATNYHHQGRYEEAANLYQEAITIRKKLLEQNPISKEKHLDFASTLFNLAVIKFDLEKYDEAIKLHTEALEIRKEILGQGHLSVADSLNGKACSLYKKNEYNEAEKLHQEALEIRIKELGKDHEDVAESQQNLAGIFYIKENYKKVVELSESALRIKQNRLGNEHISVAPILDTLGNGYAGQGDFNQAIKRYRDSIRLYRTGLEDNDHNVINVSNNLASSLMRFAQINFGQGKYDEAIKLLEEGYEIKAKYGSQKDALNFLDAMAMTHYEKKDYGKALEIYEKVFKDRKLLLGENHKDVIQSRENLKITSSKLSTHPSKKRTSHSSSNSAPASTKTAKQKSTDQTPSQIEQPNSSVSDPSVEKVEKIREEDGVRK